jgi:hypothetical protein
MPLGIFTTKTEEVKLLIEKGYTMIAAGVDSLFFGQFLQQALEIMKGKNVIQVK